MKNTKTKSQLLLQGAIDSSPLILAAIPFGLIFGAMAITTGLSGWATLSMSLFVFAGASQFIAITLLASSTALPVILMTVFLVNLRHMLYAANLMPQVENLPQKYRLPMAFWLTDETFAVVSNQVSRKDNTTGLHWYFLGSAMAMYVVWATCTVIGIVLGQQIPNIASWGLDVAMIVGFIGIVVPNLKYSADWACAVTAMFSTLITYNWPNQTGLLFSSFLAISVAVLLERRVQTLAEEKNE